MTDTPAKKSDLGVRTASAIVMIALAGTALWLGGWWWAAFVAVVALGVLWEWRTLAGRFTESPVKRGLWNAAGFAYIGGAALTLVELRGELIGLLMVIGAVIATDIGAYFAGRAIGGPKIAPRISPSKTWAGLIGGAVAAAAMIWSVTWSWHSGFCEVAFPPFIDPAGNRFQFDGPCSLGLPPMQYLVASAVTAGALIAIVAQLGDFFESWMKRRAGVKDSSNLIPGHGGLFDRVDGLLAVSFVSGIIMLLSGGLAAIR